MFYFSIMLVKIDEHFLKKSKQNLHCIAKLIDIPGNTSGQTYSVYPSKLQLQKSYINNNGIFWFDYHD